LSFLTEVLADPHMMKGTWTVTRGAPSTNDGSGRAVADTDPETFSIDGIMQPVQDGRQLALMREAAHGREVRLVITETTIDPATPAHAADVVSVKGEAWEVISAEHWQDDGQDFTRAYVARVVTP
jgi:hypothetical protein